MSSKVPPVRLATGVYLEPGLDWASRALWLKIFTLFAIAVFVGVCVVVSEVRPAALVDGIPRMLGWMATAWPPYRQELDVIAYRAFETVAIATVGTLVAALLAAPLSVLISNNISPMGKFAWPVRWLCNACRGIDTVVFAILFVAAVGLGPFAGVLGMIIHSLGVIAKLNSEAIETLPKQPLEAANMTGAGSGKIMFHAVFPAVLPNLSSVSLYVWEANVRTSTVLGIVGAGGIGIEIKAAIDLLDFQRLFTLTVAVLIMVTIIDHLSAMLRRRLV
ncbi:phosphonate ABC transporter, permease protein PhnE [Limnobacter sp.]|uniref:phosphonate ABC transporter, permease protein PhnE n=1 Tax=Limnobacter sp. TaxID=2003368 RepID=UPI002734C6A2|nr:phosphonate ABC transporter, permease protein PhnE [Limnobacter sp.]MDP3270744.1 phosphonate ABC transporter, permease protein PhnE [Limnobacter sp.]